MENLDKSIVEKVWEKGEARKGFNPDVSDAQEKPAI
jgi:hypothetical protein